MTILLGFCEVIALDVVIFAVLFATIEIFFYIRKRIAFSDNKELILFRVFVGMAAFLGLLFLVCTRKNLTPQKHPYTITLLLNFGHTLKRTTP